MTDLHRLIAVLVFSTLALTLTALFLAVASVAAEFDLLFIPVAY
jgi:hypothetical protein